MRAYQLPQGGGGIDALVKAERPDPKPAYRQAVVKVKACSLNFRDLGIVRGTYRMPVRENLIPLSDGAGEVIEVGPGVTRVKVGDHVAGCFFQRWAGGEAPADVHASALGGGIDGMLAEYAVLEEDGIVKLPGHLSLEEGATLACAGVTVWNAMMEHAKLIAGQTVLLQGTGGVSIFGLQLARMMGIQVIITSSSDDKLARAKALGANHGINYKTTPDWEKAALGFTGGHEVMPWSTPNKDAQLAELSKLSAERICWAFGVPLQLLGLANTPATSTETLMQFWLSTGLGFCLNHVEQGFDKLFGLEGEPREYTEFATEALLRSAQKDRIEALARAVQSGIYSPNEARAAEDLDAVPYGDEPRTQAQVVPLSAAGAIPTAPATAVSPSAPAVKDYREAVQLDVDALRTRTKRIAASNGAAEPQARVVRKTRENALLRSAGR